jgi:hypothetical protein
MSKKSEIQRPGLCNSKLRFVPKTAVGRGKRKKSKRERDRAKYIDKKRRASKKKHKKKKYSKTDKTDY